MRWWSTSGWPRSSGPSRFSFADLPPPFPFSLTVEFGRKHADCGSGCSNMDEDVLSSSQHTHLSTPFSSSAPCTGKTRHVMSLSLLFQLSSSKIESKKCLTVTTTTTSFFLNYPFLSLYRPVQIRSTAAERESGGQPAHRLVSPSVFILFLQQKCGKSFSFFF